MASQLQKACRRSFLMTTYASLLFMGEVQWLLGRDMDSAADRMRIRVVLT